MVTSQMSTEGQNCHIPILVGIGYKNMLACTLSLAHTHKIQKGVS